MSRSQPVEFGPRNGVVGAAGTRPRHEEEIPGPLDMRIVTSRLTLPSTSLLSTFAMPRTSLHPLIKRPYTNIIQFGIEIQRVHAAFARSGDPTPPKGVRKSRKNQQFTQVMPTFIWRATRSLASYSLVQIEAARPYFVSLAMLTASSSLSKGVTWQTGPKISSLTQRDDSGSPVRIVGCT